MTLETHLAFVLVAVAHGYAAARMRRAFHHPRYIRLQNRVAGSFLIGAGVLLAVRNESS